MQLILPTISKFYERAIYEQTVTFFDKVFHPSLSAFRSGYGCQTALLKKIEDWKKALDENKFVAAILMDLSEAFDCLPHKLLINKYTFIYVFPFARYIADVDTLFSVREIIFYQFQCRFTYSVCI
jgi:hypothetical protein